MYVYLYCVYDTNTKSISLSFKFNKNGTHKPVIFFNIKQTKYHFLKFNSNAIDFEMNETTPTRITVNLKINTTLTSKPKQTLVLQYNTI